MKASSQQNERCNKPPKYVAIVPLRFVVVACCTVALLAFALGRVARATVLHSMVASVDEELWRSDDAVTGFRIWDAANQGITTFTAAVEQQCQDEPEAPTARCGQLLTTIRFLRQEQLLSQQNIQDAFVTIARRSDLDILFHHCVQRANAGWICTVGLNDSKMLIATWPEHGHATFDISVCGDDDNRDWMVTQVLPIVQDVYKQDGTNAAARQPLVEWIFKHRGFGETNEPENPYDSDLERLLERGKVVSKQHLASVQTDFQRVDIYDFHTLPGLEAFHAYWKDPAFADRLPKNRIVLLDNVLQSTLLGDAAYHEALVHPALMAHVNPRRVAVIGRLL